MQALEALHSITFLHRDIKPGNAAIGLNKPRQVYLFDFGLARRFVVKEPGGKLRLREARKDAPFRGTYHYCSVQQHRMQDACRRDDMV